MGDRGNQVAIFWNDKEEFSHFAMEFSTNIWVMWSEFPGTSTQVSALQAFLEDVRESSKQEIISYTEFEEYYEGLSVSVPSDEDFANVLRNTWSV